MTSQYTIAIYNNSVAHLLDIKEYNKPGLWGWCKHQTLFVGCKITCFRGHTVRILIDQHNST